MNKDEWSKQSNRQYTYEYRYVHKLLGEWQQQNKITEICVVHHRDDTDEQKQKVSVKLKEHMQIMRDAYKKYKLDGGTLMWNDFRKQYKDTAVGDIQCN